MAKKKQDGLVAVIDATEKQFGDLMLRLDNLEKQNADLTHRLDVYLEQGDRDRAAARNMIERAGYEIDGDVRLTPRGFLDLIEEYKKQHGYYDRLDGTLNGAKVKVDDGWIIIIGFDDYCAVAKAKKKARSSEG